MLLWSYTVRWVGDGNKMDYCRMYHLESPGPTPPNAGLKFNESSII